MKTFGTSLVTMMLLGYLASLAVVTVRGPLIVTRQITIHDTVRVVRNVPGRVDTVRVASNVPSRLVAPAMACNDDDRVSVEVLSAGAGSYYGSDPRGYQFYRVRLVNGREQTITWKVGYAPGESMCISRHRVYR